MAVDFQGTILQEKAVVNMLGLVPLQSLKNFERFRAASNQQEIDIKKNI